MSLGASCGCSRAHTDACCWQYHPEKDLTSCLDRYGNEIRRVLGVIDAHLKKTGSEYLVGDKCTYADLMFMPVSPS